MSVKKKHNNGIKGIVFCSVAAVVLVCIFSFLCVKYNINPMLAGAFTCVFYGISLAAYLVIDKSILSGRKTYISPETGGFLTESLKNIDSPVVIYPEASGRIIWCNKCAAKIIGIRKNISFGDLFYSTKTETECLYSDGERKYIAKKYRADFQGKVFITAIMTDITEREKTVERLLGERCAIAYVSIDNLEELLNFEQEDYRYASGEAETILRNWAGENGGVLKEYQQDKFIFLFEESYLKSFVDNGFEILNKIRSITVGDGSVPVTVSVGISAGEKNISEREKEAQNALKTALQRGGDQAVVCIDGETEIYGGRTKTVATKTKVRARVMAQELASLIKKSSNVLVMAHRFADFDAFGACVGVAKAAMFFGKKVNIISDLNDTNMYSCHKWISNEKEFDDVFVESSEAMDLIEPDTLLVICDVNNVSQFESADIARRCEKVAIIDHHRKTADNITDNVLINYIEPSAGAASELVAEMLEQILPPDALTSKEADLMLAGILLDTDHFTKNTGSRTFAASLYLRTCGADVGEVQEFFKTELDDFKRELKFHDNIEVYKNIIAIATPREECTLKDRIPAAKAADRLLSIEGVKASFAIVPVGKEVFISGRSTGKINVQLILESLNGGGHFDSAGAKLEKCTSDTAKDILKNAVDLYLDGKIIK